MNFLDTIDSIFSMSPKSASTSHKRQLEEGKKEAAKEG
jgi:hypothetical protein